MRAVKHTGVTRRSETASRVTSPGAVVAVVAVGRRASRSPNEAICEEGGWAGDGEGSRA